MLLLKYILYLQKRTTTQNMKKPILYLIIPCYNEEKVLPVTKNLFLEKLHFLIQHGRIHERSRILYVNDGSRDRTWELICEFAEEDKYITGISQSRNRGHQNAVLAGLMEALDKCDITISIDCDGQDDLDAMDQMIDCYMDGCEIVYGVRSSRNSDTFFKRTTAQGYYKVLQKMGVDVVYNHADYRLVSSRVLREFADYREVNLFLRGMFPLVGFKSTCVYYERRERMAGDTHYPLKKMLSLAWEGITSLSVKPLRMIMALGALIACLSFCGVIWSVVMAVLGRTVAGWASTVCIVSFIGGVQLICTGVIGEYIGKIYMEVKHRPRYIISERTEESHGTEHD